MAEPFLSEIRIMSFGFPPKGWALCNGQLLPINQNQPLFALLGTTYGGDGRVNFGLPNLQGRTPIHMGNGHTLGELGGEQNHTLDVSEMPTHVHTAQGSATNGSTALPDATTVLGAVSNMYGPAASLTSLLPSTVSTTGGSVPHTNMQPFLTLSFCIALTGIFPTQN
ncbi:MAG TPA: tail fiber protein [Chthoniobacter sp.]|jgi:microcystin-dependent protein